MALEAFVENLDSVAETIRGEYTEVEGGFQLDVTSVNGLRLENVDNLKSAVAKERSAHKEFETKYNALATSFEGIEPTDVISAQADLKNLQTRYDKLAALDPEAEADKIVSVKVKDQVAKKQREWQTKYDEEIGSRDIKQAATTKQLEDIMIKSAAVSALSEAGGGKNVDLLTPHVLANTRLAFDNGVYVVEVVDSDGNARVGANGQNMGISDLMPELKEKWPTAFNVTVKPGGGSKGGGGGKPVPVSEMTSSQKISDGLKKRQAGG